MYMYEFKTNMCEMISMGYFVEGVGALQNH